MSEWKKVKFWDYIELNPKVLINKGEICPFIEMANVDCNMRQPRSFEYKPFTSGVKFQTYDTVIARIEPCLQNGKGFLFTKQGVGFGSTEYLVFRAKPSKTTPLFVYYFMRTHKIKTLMCNSMSGATGRQRVNNDVFLNLEVDIPSYDEQQRIATILSRYDSLIENYQKQIKLLEESAQRLYKEWFVDLHFPGHENTKIVNGVPEGWVKKKIFELGKVVTGKTPSTANKANYGGDIPFITIPDMHSGIYPTCSQTLSKQGAESQLGKYIPENSLMVSCIGTAGLVCISETLCQTNQQINSLIMENGLNLYYMYFTFLSLKEHLNNIGSNGATMTNVNKSKFENIEVVVPIDSLLDSFNIIANNTFVKIKNLSLQIRHLTEARDRLLPKLMGGEIAI